MYFIHISQLTRCIIGFSLCFYMEYLYFCNKKNRLVGFLLQIKGFMQKMEYKKT
jgi:hypothetical protein